MIIKKGILFILFINLLAAASSPAVEFNYKTECIGSYTLKLPDNLEVALYPTATYLQPKSKYPIYFRDGKKAYQSVFNYDNNNLMITNVWPDEKSLSAVIDSFNNGYDKTKITNPNDKMKLILIEKGLGYYSDFNSKISYIIDSRVYSFHTNQYYQGKERDFEFYKQNAESIIAGFSTRELFEVPQIAGKCIPFGFVAGDNPSTPLNLGVSFRVNEHPDVVITFIENTRSFSNALKFDAKEEMRNFWDYGYDYGNENIAGIKLLGFPKNRNIKMDDRGGIAGFVEIQYKDRSPSDYGYYSVVDYYSRNEKSTNNHPWLQLSVIGKASESKDKTPLTKDEIYELAKTIEASIMRRESER